MKKIRKPLLITIIVIILFGCFFALTYVPRKLVKIDSEDVSKIEIFGGRVGEKITVDDKEQIAQIINNLNEITFQKGEPSLFYSGFEYRVTIMNTKGKTYRELIINSDDTVRFRGFFYTDKSNNIPYEYIEGLFD